MTHAPASGPLPAPATVPVIAPARPAVPDGAFKPLPPGATPGGPCLVAAGWFTCSTALALACGEAAARPPTRAAHARLTGISRSFIAAATRRSWLSYTLRRILGVTASDNFFTSAAMHVRWQRQKFPLAQVPALSGHYRAARFPGPRRRTAPSGDRIFASSYASGVAVPAIEGTL